MIRIKMFAFLKKNIFNLLTILSSLVSTTTLSCISIIIEEVKIVAKNKDKCSSRILYIVLFLIFFAISIGIGAYFVY